MTVTARRMNMGARTITTGKQILGQLHGPATHVGPNALLRSSGYPPVSYSPGNTATTYGPMTVPACPAGYFRIDSSTEFSSGGLCTNWAGAPASAGASPAYVYNNNPSNLGGIVGGAGMVIDGFAVPAGAYVFQFMDLSYGGCYLTTPAPSMVFRGCRARGGAGGTGFWNSSDETYAGQVFFMYCDSGGLGTSSIAEVCYKAQHCGGYTAYRCYASITTTGLQPVTSASQIDIFECFVENLAYLNYGGGSSQSHLNGITLNGDQTNCRINRNNIVISLDDVNGHQIIDTDCISFFQDQYQIGGTGPYYTPYYPGTGTNPDGTTGYYVTGNYSGGTGHCYYLADNTTPGPIANFTVTNNLVTTSVYPPGGPNGSAPNLGGGYYGPVAFEPSWGSSGNFQSGNLWADGVSVGSTFM